MTPQKANTPIKETVSKGTDGTVVLSVKTDTKRKKKKKLVEYDKARLYPPVLGMIEEEVSTEYGRERLKELLQEMVKAEEKSMLDQGKNGIIPEVNQGVWVLGIPSLVTTKEEFVEPKITQPPEGKTPHVKLAEVGGWSPMAIQTHNQYPFQRYR